MLPDAIVLRMTFPLAFANLLVRLEVALPTTMQGVCFYGPETLLLTCTFAARSPLVPFAKLAIDWGLFRVARLPVALFDLLERLCTDIATMLRVVDNIPVARMLAAVTRVAACAPISPFTRLAVNHLWRTTALWDWQRLHRAVDCNLSATVARGSHL
jgi:hypothetical protein